jgi:hypothetical protein
MDIDLVDKVLRIGVDDLFVDIFTYPKPLSLNDQNLVSVHAVGVEAVSELLENAQQSLFLTELFEVVLDTSEYLFLALQVLVVALQSVHKAEIKQCAAFGESPSL